MDFEAIETKAKYDKMKRLIESIDANNMTPMQALQMIAKLKNEIQ